MANQEYIPLPCIEIIQPIGSFYIAVIDWKSLKTIAYADIRRIEAGEGKGVETYLGIQRTLSKNRVDDIAEYVKNVDATFPTNIILHIPSYTRIGEDSEVRNLIFDPATLTMKIRLAEDIASILDGQHRIEGLIRGFSEPNENENKFQLNITIFVDLDMDNQSMIFATVNKAQTKVNKSLVYDLFAFATTRSPQRTAHNIVKLLNNTKGSPFKDRIKILGRADDPERETVTQSTLAETIIKYISSNELKDRDTLKRGSHLRKVTGSELEKYIFRNLFIEEKDQNIAEIIWNLFKAVEGKWTVAWESQTILSKSTGIIAFMRFLRPAYLLICNKNQKEIGYVPGQKEFSEIISITPLKDGDFNKENYIPGSSGQSKLYHELLQVLDIK